MWQVLLLMPATIILYSLSKAQLDFVELGKAVASSSGILFHCFVVYACNYFLTFKFLLKTELAFIELEKPVVSSTRILLTLYIV